MQILNKKISNKFLLTTALALLFTLPSFNVNSSSAAMDDDGHHRADAAAPKATVQEGKIDAMASKIGAAIAAQDAFQEELTEILQQIGHLDQLQRIKDLEDSPSYPTSLSPERYTEIKRELSAYDRLVMRSAELTKAIDASNDEIASLTSILDKMEDKSTAKSKRRVGAGESAASDQALSYKDQLRQEAAESAAALAAVNKAIDDTQALANLVADLPPPPPPPATGVIADDKPITDAPLPPPPILDAAAEAAAAKAIADAPLPPPPSVETAEAAAPAAPSALPEADNALRLDNSALATRSKGPAGKRAPTLRRKRTATVVASPIGEAENAAANISAAVAEAPAEAAASAAGPRPKKPTALNPFGTMGAAGLKGTLRRTNNPEQFQQ